MRNVPHIVFKGAIKNTDGKKIRYLVWAETALGAARQVQALRKEQELSLESSYNVCRLKTDNGGPKELSVSWSSFSEIDDTNDILEDMFGPAVMVCL